MAYPMADSSNEARTGYRFGRFELDPQARELRKDGVRLRLQDQPLELLTMLLEHAGEVLTREALRRRLWAEGTFVDFEHGLNAAIKRLRNVLGDTAERPRFVETLPRRGYRFMAPVQRIGASGEMRRLAVLPFTSLSARGTSDDYFIEGLRDEVIAKLGRLCANRLGIIARTSSSAIQAHATSIREIGRTLHVDYVVEGRVRREHERVRVTAHLVETRGETQLWADSYERSIADSFSVQTEVATEIARSLAMELLPGGGARDGGTRHGGAYQAYLKGRYHWNKPGSSGLDEARAFLQQAVALDPSFSAAHSALARVHLAAADYYVCEPRLALDLARQLAVRALELDPADADAMLTLAEISRILDWNWEAAEKAYRQAVALNPSSESVRRHYAMFLAARRRPAEAEAQSTRACELDPLCLVVNTNAAWVSFVAHDFSAAADRCAHTLDMAPDFAPARRLLAAALIEGGDVATARVALDRLEQGALDPVSLAWLAHSRARTGDPRRAGGVLDQLGHLAGQRYVSAYHRALAHVGVGDYPGALSLLRCACEERDPAVIYLGVDPRLAPLAQDRNYHALLNTVGLTG
jgi:TolB-like protein/Tfp pilus assembly protein PilF